MLLYIRTTISLNGIPFLKKVEVFFEFVLKNKVYFKVMWTRTLSMVGGHQTPLSLHQLEIVNNNNVNYYDLPY